MKGYILLRFFFLWVVCLYNYKEILYNSIDLTNVWSLKFNQKNKLLMPYIGHSTQIIHNNTVTVYPTVALNSSE